ncbi:serine-rich adhesin for platelets-like isoform X2 [Ostrea edulis]|uniref:serine-rich adhesin for platelets-like isoform X2 n=1 Tax=Ostrea edulis TaxID=37623 RepID=UPI0024AF70AD|nr:serine-rich adhesin for platelets-like isoform X2 [Ostrea edulis]
MKHSELLRKIWPLLRESMIDPIELIPDMYVRYGFNDNDVESIKAAYNTSETFIGKMKYKNFKKWAEILKEGELWKTLGEELDLNREQIKDLEKKDNPGEAVLDLFLEKTVRDLLQLLGGDQRFSDLIQCIREDLGEADYNNLNINPSGDQNAEGFITVNLGPSSRNDSSSNLQNNKNILSGSPSLNQSSSPESGSEKSSKPSSTSTSPKLEEEKSLKSTSGGVTLSGNFSSDRGISAQKEEQVPPPITLSGEPASDGVNFVIAESQREIAQENERKNKIHDTSMTNIKADITSQETASFHQTSPKSSVLDDNLNDPQDFFKENMISSTKNIGGHNTKINAKHVPDGATSNLDVNSESKAESSSEVMSHPVQILPRGPIAQNEEIDTNEVGSNIVKAAKDLRKGLEDDSLGEISTIPRPSGNSINIPVQTTGSTEEGSPMAVPESTASSRLDLFGSCPQTSMPAEQQNISMERQLEQTIAVPVPVSDDSEVKNIEMEARALHNDTLNTPVTQSFRDIQNSMPDENVNVTEGRVSSIVNQYAYNAEVTSQGQSSNTNLSETQNSLQQMSGSENLSNGLSNVALLSDSLLSNTEATICSNEKTPSDDR